MRDVTESNGTNETGGDIHQMGPDEFSASGNGDAVTPPLAMLGVVFDHLTLQGAVERIGAMIASRKPHYVVTANVDFVVQAQRDVELRRILNSADALVCDGTPLIWASRFLGTPLPERVAGADLVPQLFRLAAKKNHRVFLLGATPEANDRAVVNARAQFPGLRVSGYSPPFQPLSEINNVEIHQRVEAARPDLLFVAFGCPKAEKWIAANHQALGVPVTIGVGATIDFLAGHARRAPLWMQRAGAEWIFRLGCEPRRLFGRYLKDICGFFPAIAAQWWRLRAGANRTASADSTCVTVRHRNWCRIQSAQRLDAGAVRELDRIRASCGKRLCLVDLSCVRFIDSAGAAWLLRSQREIHIPNSRVIFLAPSFQVRRVLKWMFADKEFVFASDAAEARGLPGNSPEDQAGKRLFARGFCAGTRQTSHFRMGPRRLSHSQACAACPT